MSSVFDVLDNRGFIAQMSDAALRGRLAAESVTLYVGFDPTADSLHLGHLVPIMALTHFQRAGHRVILVVGGATGMVGDPSGKSEERQLLTPEGVAANVVGVRRQLQRFLRFDGENPAIIVDNNEWIAPMSFIDWLREVGKFFTVNYMLAKDSVQTRLSSEQGLSYTEFSYMTMQAYDFLHLFDAHGCTLQCGGNDQWGNITAGIELIRKVRQGQAFGMTFPLVTTATGEKFGKSAGNALWLDAGRTSPWDFYQYWVRQDDRDVIRFLNLYTFLPLEEIRDLEVRSRSHPEAREAQRTLAFEATALVHGRAIATEIQEAAEVIYYAEIHHVSDDVLAQAFAGAPSSDITRNELERGVGLPELLARIGMAKSKGEASRLLRAGGVYVNNVRAVSSTLSLSDLASPSLIVLRTGKKNYFLLRVV